MREHGGQAGLSSASAEGLLPTPEHIISAFPSFPPIPLEPQRVHLDRGGNTVPKRTHVDGLMTVSVPTVLDLI